MDWLIPFDAISRTGPPDREYTQPYGNLVELNAGGLIATSIPQDILKGIVQDYLDVLGTSAAVYERNGDYALGIFASGWCRFLDQSSRNLCDTPDNHRALESGRWLCHESCWQTSKTAMERGEPVDCPCHGGIRIYAIPIVANGEVVGSMNFGYGDPTREPDAVARIAEMYHVAAEDLCVHAAGYAPRPAFLIEIAKSRLQTAARLIGALIERRLAEDRLRERTVQLEAAQSQLVHAAKLAAIGRLAASIAHEFNSPLCGVRNVLEQTLESRDVAPERRKLLELAVRECNRMTDLVERLRDFYRPSSGQAGPVHVHEALEDVVRLMGKTFATRQITLARSYSPKDPVVTVVEDQFRQVLLNLLTNAVEAIGDGQGTIMLSTDVGADGVTVSVQDTGHGIRPEHLDRVFEPFFTTKSSVKGTGLGLAVSYGIIQSFAGDLSVQSPPGRGATFTIRLPGGGDGGRD